MKYKRVGFYRDIAVLRESSYIVECSIRALLVILVSFSIYCYENYNVD